MPRKSSSTKSQTAATKKKAAKKNGKKRAKAKKNGKKKAGKKNTPPKASGSSKPFRPPTEPAKAATVKARLTAEKKEADMKAAAAARREKDDAEIIALNVATTNATQNEYDEIEANLSATQKSHDSELADKKKKHEDEIAAKQKAHQTAAAELKEKNQVRTDGYRDALLPLAEKLGIEVPDAAPTATTDDDDAPATKGKTPSIPKGLDTTAKRWAQLTREPEYQTDSTNDYILAVLSNAGRDQAVTNKQLLKACKALGWKGAEGSIAQACNKLREQKLITNRGCERGENKITAPGEREVQDFIAQYPRRGDDEDETTTGLPPKETEAAPIASTNGRAGKRSPLGSMPNHIVLAVHRAGGRQPRAQTVKDTMKTFPTKQKDSKKFSNSFQSGLRKASDEKWIETWGAGREAEYRLSKKGKKLGKKLDKQAQKLKL